MTTAISVNEGTDLETDLAGALAELERVAPGVPLLALGQTVAWDEPMKAGLVRLLAKAGSGRSLVFGVHDTDYFAKAPGAKIQPGGFAGLTHNDTNTRGLWSAAGEFSSLFGGETVVTREAFAKAGLRAERLQQVRPAVMDALTEAWGWRGLVSLDASPPVTADVRLADVYPELRATFEWAINASLDCLVGEGRREAELEATRLIGFWDLAFQQLGPTATLADFYEALLPEMAKFATGIEFGPTLSTTRTSQLLKFNQATCHLPRFELLDHFLNPALAPKAIAAYDGAVAGSGLYPVHRFGTGAIPFDVYIPGIGRGTLRLGTRGAVINTNRKQFLSYKRKPESVAELAAALEAKFGPNCAVVGKAVTLIGMLGQEFAFVFHEGASSYVRLSRKLHQALGLKVNPLLRIRYDTWSSLSVGCSWIRLPEPLRRPFGTDELCAPSVASRWVEVGVEQEALLHELGEVRRPIDLIEFLDRRRGGAWKSLAKEYLNLHQGLLDLKARLETVRTRRIGLYEEVRALKVARREAETEMGAHFRAQIFEKNPSAEDLAERERLSARLAEVIERQEAVRHSVRLAHREQRDLSSVPDVMKAQNRRKDIEFEAELMRAQIVREAVISARGLAASSLRPSAWWFKLVSPDGLWYSETMATAKAYLEPLS